MIKIIKRPGFEFGQQPFWDPNFHTLLKLITVAVAKVPCENITLVSLGRNPWKKVLPKPFRSTET